jgi:hypothetical protein
VVSADTNWNTTGPTNGDFQFTDCTINAGVTLSVASGTKIFCSGSFTNNGTVFVLAGLPGERWFGNPDGFPGVAGNALAPGRAYSPATLRHLLDPGPVGGGNGGRGNGSPDNDGGTGGGSLVIFARDGLTNAGTIEAVGGAGQSGDGNDDGGAGGGGGFLIFVSDGNITNTGVIDVRGGNGAPGDPGECGGGGGGGGVVHYLSPNANSVAGSGLVLGGSAGSGICSCCGSAIGGAMGGDGGRGSDDNLAATAGSVGLILRTQTASPTALF